MRDENYKNVLRQKALKVAQEFDWLKTAQKTLQVYQNLLESSK